MLVKTCFWKDIRRCIEAVITSTIGNRVVLNGAHGFKSHHLRHVGAKFALLRFSLQKNVRLLPCSSFSVKSHVRVGYLLASALITLLAHYQPFAVAPYGAIAFLAPPFP